MKSCLTSPLSLAGIVIHFHDTLFWNFNLLMILVFPLVSHQSGPFRHSLLIDNSMRGRACEGRSAGFPRPEECFQQSNAFTLGWHRQSSRALPWSLQLVDCIKSNSASKADKTNVICLASTNRESSSNWGMVNSWRGATRVLDTKKNFANWPLGVSITK